MQITNHRFTIWKNRTEIQKNIKSWRKIKVASMHAESNSQIEHLVNPELSPWAETRRTSSSIYGGRDKRPVRKYWTLRRFPFGMSPNWIIRIPHSSRRWRYVRNPVEGRRWHKWRVWLEELLKHHTSTTRIPLSALPLPAIYVMGGFLQNTPGGPDWLHHW